MDQYLQTRLPIYALISLTTILGSYIFLGWAVEGGLTILTQFFFSQSGSHLRQVKTLISTAYYSAVVAIIGLLYSKLYSLVLSNQNFFEETIQALTKGFYGLIVFTGLFYKMISKKQGVNYDNLRLISCCFIIGEALLLLSTWMHSAAKLKINIVGHIFLGIIFIIMIGEILSPQFLQVIFSL